MNLLYEEFAPDLAPHMSGKLSAISNLYPGANGYRPVGVPLIAFSALPLPCRGASSFTSPDGRSVIIAGTSAALYTARSGGFVQIGTGYSIQGEARWRFAPFGNFAVATNGIDAMQKVDVANEIVAPLGGTPPRFRMLAVVQNFLVGGVLNDDVMVCGWSGENNAEWWTWGQRKSDYNTFADGGEITGIIGGEYGLILQRRCIRRMSYVGGNLLFRFDKIAPNEGCVTVNSVAQHGELAFFYSDSGFKMWDGAGFKGIGFERVDATFAARYNVADWGSMSADIDPVRNTVAWSMGDAIWTYNWALDRWSVIDVTAQIIFSGVTKTVSLDEQDPAVGAPDDDLDGAGLDSFDAARFKGGDPRFYLFTSDNSLATLSGPNLAASLTTQNIEFVKGRDARLRRVRPLCDAVGGTSLTLTTRQRLGDAGQVRTFTTLNTTGEMPVRARGRYTTVRHDIAGGASWTYLQGIEPTIAAGGSR